MDENTLIGDANKTNLQKLANLYAMYEATHGWKGPADEKTFKDFIQKSDVGLLKPMGVDPNNVDALFTSDRDGQPFKIRYAVQGSMGSKDAVIFEQGGKNGKFLVGFTSMIQKEVEKGEYDDLFSGKVQEKKTERLGPPPAGGQ